MPSVAFFANQFADATGHGLARYARELHAALRRIDDVDATPIAAWTSLARPDFDVLAGRTGLRLTGLGRRLTPLAWAYLGWPPLERLLGGRVDVVHAVALGYPVATRRPLVVTIHDLGPLTHPEYFSGTRPWVMERSLRQAERQADAVICVSQATADEVEGYLGPAIAPRIHVVAEGVSPAFFAPDGAADLCGLALPPAAVPFILAAGKISPRKNVQAVVAALGRLGAAIPHHLVLVGGSGWDTEIVARAVADAGIAARVHSLGYVSDGALRALYRRAAVYVHPSLYEGFGLTVLEAMAAGAPVVASNAPALPEVVGEAGLMVDPRDVAALAEAIRAVCTDAGLAAALRERGRRHAARFSWDACAEGVAAIYRGVAR